MARLLADEDVYTALKRTLSALGHDILSPNDGPLKGAGDHIWLLRASKMDRILITHNYDDFALLHRAWFTWAMSWEVSPLPNHPGILAVPQRDLLAVERTAEAIDNLLTVHQPSIMNQLIRLRRDGEWINRTEPLWGRGLPNN